MNNGPILPNDVIEALHAGRKVDAIKRLREARGLGLAEAKDMVERYARDHAISSPRTKTVASFWPVFAVLCIAVAGYFITRLLE